MKKMKLLATSLLVATLLAACGKKQPLHQVVQAAPLAKRPKQAPSQVQVQPPPRHHLPRKIPHLFPSQKWILKLFPREITLAL